MTVFAASLLLFPAGLLQGAESVSRVAANSVISGLWQGIALVAGASLCLRLLPRTTAAIRFAVWTAVFAMLALLPLLHAYVRRSGGPMTGSGAVVQVDVRWSWAIAVLWMGASLLRAVMLGLGVLRLWTIWRRAMPLDIEAGECKTLSRGASRRVQVCTSPDVDRPSVIGFFSPRILIPEELFGRLSATELEQIVLHEMGHLRRADDWMNLLQKASLVLVPLNPVLMWIERRLCFERELACDDDVLLQTGAPKAYATCLANLAEHRLRRKAVSSTLGVLSLGAWEQRSELARRVHRILRPSERMSGLQARVAVGMMSVALMAGAVELSRCPQLVSFSGQVSGVSETMAAGVPRSSSTYSAATYSRPAYQAVVFHPSSHAGHSESGAGHEVLLKAVMPTASAQKSVSKARTRRRASSPAPALLRTKQVRRTIQQQGRRWVVLTSFTPENAGDWGQPRVIFTESGECAFSSSSYAAVPTEAGWLVIQL